jgi:hypothetical protein
MKPCGNCGHDIFLGHMVMKDEKDQSKIVAVKCRECSCDQIKDGAFVVPEVRPLPPGKYDVIPPMSE